MRITDDVFDSVDDPAVPVQRAVLRPAARAGHWMVDGADGQHVPRRPRRRRELKKVRDLAKRERLLLAHDLAVTLGTESDDASREIVAAYPKQRPVHRNQRLVEAPVRQSLVVRPELTDGRAVPNSGR